MEKTTAHQPVIDFSTTIWYGADMKMLAEHLSAHLMEYMQTYPEPDAETLRTMIARRHDLSPDNIVVTPGPTAAFYQLAAALPAKKALVPHPALPDYERALERYGWEVVRTSGLSPLEEWPLDEVDLCLLASPNNPDARILSHAELLRTIKKYPKTKFVVDQSYASFTTTNKLKPADLKSLPNLISVWSFSHAYGIPGLRIGYIVAAGDVTARLADTAVPYTVNSLALEAAKYILIHPAQFTLPIRKWLRSAQELMAQLRCLDYLEVLPSETTFFLVHLKRGKASDLAKYLAEEHSLLVAEVKDFCGLEGDNYLRITARDEESNNRLVVALEAWGEQL